MLLGNVFCDTIPLSMGSKIVTSSTPFLFVRLKPDLQTKKGRPRHISPKALYNIKYFYKFLKNEIKKQELKIFDNKFCEIESIR